MEPETHCPHCGEALTGDAIQGLCAICLARSTAGRLDDLLNLADHPALDGLAPAVPGFVLHQALGIGGMGQVYEATEIASGLSVAVKILSPRWTSDEEAAARFRAEAEALRQLEHPGIVRLHSTGLTEDGRLFIAMELVTGCDLGRLLRAEKLDPSRACDIFLKVCAALQHAHGCGIVHRDLKPSNILIGRDGTVKLADFGLARHLSDDSGSHVIGNLTETRDTFGTPYYIAPEALRGRQKDTPAADIYAAGVLLYHLLTGSPPLGNYTPLSQAAGLPRSVDAPLAAALQADPAKRSATVAGLIRGVEATQRRQSWRRRKLIGLGTAATLLLTAAAWTFGWLAGRPAPPPPPPVFTNPALATNALPWTNSLGMKFVPAGGPNLLFCVHETRRRDFEGFSLADQAPLPEWRVPAQKSRRRLENVQTLTSTGWQDGRTSWKDPGFAQTPEDPATGIAQLDAEIFCTWLTVVETREGRLKNAAYYRLPTAEEWSLAAGASLPTENCAGPEARMDPWPETWPVLQRNDNFPRTSPAGSFPPLPNGLCDMGGNVTEWTSTIATRNLAGPPAAGTYFHNGPSWATGVAQQIIPGYRRSARRFKATVENGFRCVLDLNPPPPPDAARDRQASM